eukprot:gb/GFBE01057221.1/.p1 GENE.gb/GFBE01057221.1/~~gb/GFBE01057221.1/.p1  ORF type:complete len:444 (+),score=82.67 gb/GFBE01057221.1/:1-1332(+)
MALVVSWMLLLLNSICGTAGLDNGVGLRPPMGYNTWNDLGCDHMNETNVKAVADAMLSTGLKAAGYKYVNLDDCWHAETRDNVTGRLMSHPVRFPSGMKALGDYLHSKGLKFGIYTDRGAQTCQGLPGSLGHEELDAQTFADWGVDYVKEDNCHAEGGPNDKDALFAQFGAFRDGLNKTGRAIFFSVCGGGGQLPWNDIRYYATDPRGGRNLANSWRITPDVIEAVTLQDAALTDASLATASGPGGFNDPDMLLGSSAGATRSLTRAWSRTQFNIWAVLMAPLLIGAPPCELDSFDLETYTNLEVIKVNQDPLLQQGQIVHRDSMPFLPGSSVVWARNLSDGSAAVVFVNSGWLRKKVTCNHECWSHLPFAKGTALQVRDLWTHTTAEAPTATAGSDYSVAVNGRGASRMLKFTPLAASGPQPISPEHEPGLFDAREGSALII